MGLKDCRQHPGQLKPPIAAAEADQRFSRIYVLDRTKQLAMKTICFETVNLLFRSTTSQTEYLLYRAESRTYCGHP